MKTHNLEEMTEISASDEQLAAINELAVEVDQETLPDDPPRPAEEYAAWVRSAAPFEHKRMWLIREGGLTKAVSEIRWEEKEENRHLAGVWVGVTGAERRRGLALEVLRPVAAAARELDRSLLYGWIIGGTSHEEFARQIGAEFSMNEYHNRLFIEELDRSLLDDWIVRASERAADYSLEFWHGPTKQEELEAFAPAMDIMNTAPRPDDWEDEQFTPETIRQREERWEAVGFEMWRYVARHRPTGAIAGYTAMFPNRWRPEFADQGDTGVVGEHQNRGLGRWLKAAMLVKVLEERPQTRWVETGNASTNKPMLAINNALGFRAVETWATWQIKTQTLEARLSRLSQNRP